MTDTTTVVSTASPATAAPLREVGALIRGARKGRSMTQAQLAESVGTSQSAINRIEQGGQNLSLEMLT
uniref:helix-turn-helix transcriptional regulator n=1 Tax=Curtobacterium flaccumfaciens TaxID=2035 RepID=UPI003CE7487C